MFAFLLQNNSPRNPNPSFDLMKKVVISIQYLRGLAAMIVVYHHCVRKVLELNPESVIPYSGFGNAGVDIFFDLPESHTDHRSG